MLLGKEMEYIWNLGLAWIHILQSKLKLFKIIYFLYIQNINMRLKHQIKLAPHLNKMLKVLKNVYKFFTISILKNCKAFECTERIIIWAKIDRSWSLGSYLHIL